MRFIYLLAIVATFWAGCSKQGDPSAAPVDASIKISLVICHSGVYGAIGIAQSDQPLVESVSTDGACNVIDSTSAKVLVEGLFAPACVVTLRLTDGSQLTATVDFSVYPEGSPCQASAVTCQATDAGPPSCTFERRDASPG
jgi:hypothetical protein